MFANPNTTPRLARVFLSSTFRDLSEERTAITSDVYRRLRAFAQKRGIDLQEFVDLRWGILDSQIERGRLLDLCLRSIDCCTPFFAGIVGTSKGTAASPALLAQLPESGLGWSRRDVQAAQGFSITEAEFWHALVVRQKTMLRTSFYLRKQERAVLASALEQQLQTLQPQTFGSVNELSRQLEHTLRSQLQAEFGDCAHEVSDGLQAVAAAHNQFAALRLRHYLRDQHALRTVKQRLERSPGRYVLVNGEAGAGKSSFMACLARELLHRQQAPAVFLHFCSMDEASADLDELLARLLGEMAAFLGQADESNGLKLVEKVQLLPVMLARTGQEALRRGRQAVFLLDGLDQLTNDTVDHIQPQRLWTWLPEKPPAGTAMLLSWRTSSDVRIDASERLPRTVSIRPLERRTASRLLKTSLLPRTLAPALLEQLTSSPLGGSPLFLVTAAGELQLLTSRDRLGSAAHALSSCSDAEDLFGLVLERAALEFEQAMGPGSRGQLWRLLGLILFSRHGLEPHDLEQLTSREQWTLASLLLHDQLVCRGGRYAFSHEKFRDAVQRFIRRHRLESWCQCTLARHFYRLWQETPGNDMRIHLELPWHLAASGDTSALTRYLTDIETLAFRSRLSLWESCSIYRRVLPEERRAWSAFLAKLRRACRTTSAGPRAIGEALLHLGRVLNVINRNAQAIAVLGLLKDHATPGSIHRQRGSLTAGDAAREASDYTQARGHYLEALQGSSRSRAALISDAQFGLARIHRLQGEHEPALQRYQQALHTLESMPANAAHRRYHLPWRHFGLGEIHRLRGDLEQSQMHYAEANRLFTTNNDERGQAYAAWGLGDVARLQGRHASARRHYDRSARLCATIPDPRSEAWACLGLAETARARFYQSHATADAEEVLSQCQRARALALRSPTECCHADLHEAECLRLQASHTPVAAERARELYRRCITFYSNKQMHSCLKLSEEGLALLNAQATNGDNTPPLHPLSLP